MAQNVEALPEGAEDTVFDDTWVSVGVGAIYSPSYDGSDDYVVSAIPIIQGKVGGVRISPRPGGAALDFVDDGSEGARISAGVAAKLNRNRNRGEGVIDIMLSSHRQIDTLNHALACIEPCTDHHIKSHTICARLQVYSANISLAIIAVSHDPAV